MTEKSDKVVDFPKRELIERQAAGWLLRRESGDLDPSERSALDAWLRSSERHRTIFAEMAAVWGDASILADLGDIADAVEPEDRATTTRRPRMAALGAAALLVVAAGVGLAVREGEVAATATARDYVTDVGEQRTVLLSDGSRVQLNTDTSLSVELSASARRVRLLDGEAFFEVAHDPSRPFEVASPAGTVRALGTAFATRLRGRDTLEVTVADGRVAVTLEGAGRTRDARALAQEANELSAGSTAIFSSLERTVRPATTVEIDRKLAWRDGVLVFAGEPLRTVVEDVSRYTDVDIVIGDPSIESLPIGGYFRVGETEALFETLELTFGLRVERSPDGRVLLSRGA